jgi:hypothetical protein
VTRVPLPKEVRPALGPLVEAVPLLFRIESLEIAALLGAATFALEVELATSPLSPFGAWTIMRGLSIDPLFLAREFLHALLAAAAVLLLVPVAAGDRGLRVRVLSAHFGSLAFAASMLVGIRGIAEATLSFFAFLSGGPPGVPFSWSSTRPFWFGAMPMVFTVWAAWLFGNAVRRREGRPTARARLLAWPGLFVAVLLGSIVSELARSGAFRFWLKRGHAPEFVYLVVFLIGTSLARVFAALWMLRVIENEAEADPRP